MSFREKEKIILDTILESERYICQLSIKFSNISCLIIFSYDNRIRPSPVVTASSQNGKNSKCYVKIDQIVYCVLQSQTKSMRQPRWTWIHIWGLLTRLMTTKWWIDCSSDHIGLVNTGHFIHCRNTASSLHFARPGWTLGSHIQIIKV